LNYCKYFVTANILDADIPHATTDADIPHVTTIEKAEDQENFTDES